MKASIKRETRGRPAIGARHDAGNMEVKRVTIDQKTVDTLRRLGSGNLSAGVRIAADIVETIKGKVDAKGDIKILFWQD